MTEKPTPRVPIRPSQLINPAPAVATLHATAVEWLTRALRQELPEASEPYLGELAESLHSIALAWDVPMEVVVAWIHRDLLTSESPAGAFRRWCQDSTGRATPPKLPPRSVYPD